MFFFSINKIIFQSFVPFSVTCPHVYSLPPFPSFPVLLSLLGPSHYSVKPHFAHYKQFQIQKFHEHLDDVNKKKIIMWHVIIVHVVIIVTYGHSALHSQARIWTFILLITRLWPV